MSSFSKSESEQSGVSSEIIFSESLINGPNGRTTMAVKSPGVDLVLKDVKGKLILDFGRLKFSGMDTQATEHESVIDWEQETSAKVEIPKTRPFANEEPIDKDNIEVSTEQNTNKTYDAMYTDVDGRKGTRIELPDKEHTSYWENPVYDQNEPNENAAESSNWSDGQEDYILDIADKDRMDIDDPSEMGVQWPEYENHGLDVTDEEHIDMNDPSEVGIEWLHKYNGYVLNGADNDHMDID
jgi:hypothetical protein